MEGFKEKIAGKKAFLKKKGFYLFFERWNPFFEEVRSS
jgi:hypothetical protein